MSAPDLRTVDGVLSWMRSDAAARVKASRDVRPSVDDSPDGVTRCAACGNDVAVLDKRGLCAECWA